MTINRYWVTHKTQESSLLNIKHRVGEKISLKIDIWSQFQSNDTSYQHCLHSFGQSILIQSTMHQLAKSSVRNPHVFRSSQGCSSVSVDPSYKKIIRIL